MQTKAKTKKEPAVIYIKFILKTVTKKNCEKKNGVSLTFRFASGEYNTSIIVVITFIIKPISVMRLGASQ
jgi:hypothetical protein